MTNSTLQESSERPQDFGGYPQTHDQNPHQEVPTGGPQKYTTGRTEGHEFPVGQN